MKKTFSLSGARDAFPMPRCHLLFSVITAVSLTLPALAVNAQSTPPADHAAHHLSSAPVDVATSKVTLRHGRIENLDMPGMTMVFQATDPKLLNGLKEGDKVRFVAGLANGALTVSSIEKAE